MDKTITTDFLKYPNSSFEIDLKQNGQGLFYVEVSQTINNEIQTLKLNPKSIPDLIKLLERHQKEIDQNQPPIKKAITIAQGQKLENYYLKGVPIEHLSLQFEMTEFEIIQTLKERDIKVVPEKKPKY